MTVVVTVKCPKCNFIQDVDGDQFRKQEFQLCPRDAIVMSPVAAKASP